MKVPYAFVFGLMTVSALVGCNKSRLTEERSIDPLPQQKPIVMQTPSMQSQAIGHKAKPY